MAEIYVVSGPSGSGKGTILGQAVPKLGNVYVSVSMTTRKPREGEVDGVSYHFVSRDEFLKNVRENGMLEYAEYCGEYYGTPKAPVIRAVEEGKDVVLEIDTAGMKQVRDKLPHCVTVFIAPPSLEELEKRLRGRDPNEKKIDQRLAKARQEMTLAPDYDHTVVNDGLEAAVDNFCRIVSSGREKTEGRTSEDR